MLKPIGITAVAAMIAVGAVSCADLDTTSGSGLTTDRPAAVKSDGPAPAGSAVRDGKFEFTVTEVERTNQVSDPTGNPYMTVDAQGEFVVVTLNVHNIGDQARSFYGGNQKLVDAKGREYQANSEADVWMNPETGDINPGNSIVAKVAFDVPPGTVVDHLVLHDSMFSGGASLAL